MIRTLKISGKMLPGLWENPQRKSKDTMKCLKRISNTLSLVAFLCLITCLAETPAETGFVGPAKYKIQPFCGEDASINRIWKIFKKLLEAAVESVREVLPPLTLSDFVVLHT